MLLLQFLLIIAQCIRVHMLNAIENTLQQGVQIGVHTPAFNPSRLNQDQQFIIIFEQSFTEIPKVQIWLTEISEKGGGTNKVRIYAYVVTATIKKTEFRYNILMEGTQVKSLSVQWIASKLLKTELLMQDVMLDKAGSSKFLWDVTFKVTPSVLFFFREIETYETRKTSITISPSTITSTSITITKEIGNAKQKAYAIFLAFSNYQLQTINGQLNTDVFYQSDWITNAAQILKTFRYPVKNQDYILRGFYAFNNYQSDFNAKIKVTIVQGQTQGQLECSIPTAQAQPLEGFKFMVGQLALIQCPPKSLYVAPNCQCSEGYYDDVTDCKGITYNGMKECPLTCKKCTSTTTCQECITGISNLVLVPKGLCECSSGYFYDSPQCSKCPVNCLSCSSVQTCLSCDESRTLQNDRCYCNNGYFEDTQLICQKCRFECTSCENKTKCTSCSEIQHRHLLNSNCICKPGYFGLDNDCYKCRWDCSECDSLESCQSCNRAEMRELFESKCLCVPGYFEDQEQTCKECFSGCVSCLDNQSCLSCNGSLNLYLVDAKCVCQQGFYEQDTICNECSAKCRTCSSGEVCLSCDESRNLKNALCHCHDGYYEDTKLVCQKCHSECTSCKNETKCTSCSEVLHRILLNSTCICESGYFELDLNCQKCRRGCLECTSLESCQGCIIAQKRELVEQLCKCINGYFEDQQQQCQQCSQTCHQCSDHQSCLACDRNLNRLLIDAKCICQQGFYEKDTICTSINDFVKLECQPPCSSCLTNTECLSCIDQKANLVDSNCVCSLGYYLEIDKCQKCSNKCLDCQDFNSCINCQQNSNRDITKNCVCSQTFQEDERGQCVKQSSERESIQRESLIEKESKVQSKLISKDSSSKNNSSLSVEKQTSIMTNQSIFSQHQLNQGQNLTGIQTNMSIDNFKETELKVVKSKAVVTPECGQGCLKCETSNKCSSCDTSNHLRLSSLGICICDDTFTEIEGICQACQYPCLFCSDSPYNCTSCDTYHTLNSSNQCSCKPPWIENIKQQQCQQDQTIDANIIGAFDEAQRKQFSCDNYVIDWFIIISNLAIPIGIFGLITNSPQFLLLDLFIKPVHPPKVYKSLETLSRFVIPIYLPEVQGSYNHTSLMLFGAYNATQYAYQYGQPLNETYMNTLGFSPYSIITCSQHLIVLLFAGLTWLLTSILMRHNISKKTLSKVQKHNFGLLHLIIESGTLFLAISSIYTLNTIGEFRTLEVLPLFIVSILTSLLLLGLYCGYLLYIMYSIIFSHHQKDEMKLEKRFTYFFQQVRTHKVASSLFKVTSQLKKIVYAFIVIFLNTLQGYIALITLQSIFTIYILLVMPQQFVRQFLILSSSIFILDMCLQALYIVFLGVSLRDHLVIDEAPSGDVTFCFILCVLLFNLMGTVGKVIAGFEFNKAQQNECETNFSEGSPEEVSVIVNNIDQQ